MQSPPNEIPFFFTHIFSWVLVVIGAEFTRNGVRSLRRAFASNRWPTAEGRVTECGIGSHEASDNGHETLYAKIQYRYSVDGNEYTGTRISFAGLDHTGTSAETYMKEHPMGSIIQVFHDPNHPADAMLEPGVRAHGFVKLFFGLLILGSGAALVYAFRAWRF